MKLIWQKEKSGEAVNTKPKKKLTRKAIALIVVVALIAVFAISGLARGGSSIPVVETVTVSKGNIEQTVSISGTVESADTKSYYAPVAARVDTVSVTAGDRVDSGEAMILFDASELELAKQQAELSLQQANGTYDNSIELASDASSKLANAEANLPAVEASIDEVQAQIDDLNDKINEKTRRMNQTATDLQKTLLDVDQDGSEDGTTDQDYNRQDDDGKEVRLEVQEALQDVQYAISNDEEIAGWNKQITELNEQLSDLKEEKSELESDKASGESGEITSGQKSYLDATQKTSELTAQDTIGKIEEIENGIVADFNGIVTEVGIEDGATTQAGTKLVTVASTDTVKITIQISKADLTKIKEGQTVDITINGNSYTGSVSKVSGTAKNNSSGVPVVDAEITVDNPDDNIILGVEASNKIHTDSASDVIVLPYEYISTDTEGDFVYVVENGTAVKRSVTTGVTSGTEAEVTDGLSEGDMVIISDTEALTDGQIVTAVDTASDSSSAK